MADERGFMIVLVGPPESHRRKYSTIMDTRLFNFLSGGLHRFCDEYARLTGRHIVRVVVTEPDPTGAFVFHFTIPSLVRFKPIVAALDLFSKERKGPHTREWKGTGFLECTKYSDRYEYLGRSRNALECVVRVLEMKHHREILLKSKDE